MSQVVRRRPEFEGTEGGLDSRTLKAMRVQAGNKDHPSRAVLNALAGGLWTENRVSRVYGSDDLCRFCQKAEGFASHFVFDCPAFTLKRKEAEIQPRSSPRLTDSVPCVVPTIAEPSVKVTTDEVLFTDGSGKHPVERAHRR
eukprot:2319342-Amphidinium_carterae.1